MAQELADHPDLSSREVADRLALSRDELVAAYSIIQASEELQRLVIENSKAPRLTVATSDLVTRYEGYLTRVLSGKEVFPLILEFHPGPLCQCQCKFCFSGGWDYGEYLEAATPIHPDRLRAIFAECGENGVEEVWFSGGKEPLVNGLTPEYIRMANEMGFRTRLYTNGVSMNKRVQEAILDCYQVRISCSGAKPATYARVQFPQASAQQTNGVFDKVLDNISSLVKLKKANNKNLRIGMSQILQPDNYDEMLQFVDLGQRLGVDSMHFRLEAMGKVRDFTPGEKGVVLSQISELMKDHSGIELDIRGVAEGEFESRQSQFLPGLRRPSVCRAGLLKRGLNPYGALYYCEFSSHPRFRLDSAHLRLGDAAKNSLADILWRRQGRYPPPCQLCQAHEYGLNITLERLEKDLEYGIPINRQPYYRKLQVQKQNNK